MLNRSLVTLFAAVSFLLLHSQENQLLAQSNILTFDFPITSAQEVPAPILGDA